MAKLEWIERRLGNWVRWRTQADRRSGGYPKANILARWKEGWQTRGREAVAYVPINDAEAWATDKAIKALPTYLRETVEQCYLQSCSVTEDAVALGCSVSTVHARVSEANAQLAAALGCGESAALGRNLS